MENSIKELKIILREENCPYFSDDDLKFYLSQNGNDIRKTAFQCFLVKAEDTALSVSGLSAADTSKYFRRLAQQYRTNNSGVLKS